MIGHEIGRVDDADPDRDDGLAEGDDHDQPVALGEVAGGVQPPPDAPARIVPT